MMRRMVTAVLLCLTLAAQQPAVPVSKTKAAQQPSVPVFQASANLVIVTVFARDRDGKPARGLKKDDFLVLENGKPQTVSVFEFQELNSPPATSSATPEAAPAPTVPTTQPAETPLQGRVRFRDRRLLVLFFDWSSMQTAEQVRAKDAAEKYLAREMSPNDLVMLAAFGTRLKVDQEFTDDKDLLLAAIRKHQAGEMSELAGEANTEEDSSEDSTFAADETEFNLFNTDRKLSALEDLAKKLSGLPEKKAIIYFSSGVGRTGAENQAQLQATINAAVRSNVSFYPIDARGLMAEPPGGAASSATSLRGNSMFSGRSQNQQRQSNLDQQDTLYALASDTGGKALLDTNDLGLGIKQAQEDLDSYYILGYYSSDERRDGRFRRVEVKLTAEAQARTSAKLDYRRGYFSEKEFRAFTAYDKEKQLQDALLTGDPVTDLRLAIEVNWFRTGASRYFVPLAVKIPGSAVPLKKKGSGESTEFDFIGQVKDSKGATAATVRDTIKINLRDEQTGKLPARNLVYDTGFTLEPGEYKLKMLVRENLTGKMGTFETRFKIPDLLAVKDAARLSSVVWAAQRVPMTEAVGLADKKLKTQARHPLVDNGQKLLPSVTHVFHRGQPLYVYAEMYDPVQPEPARQPAVSAAVTVYHWNRQVYQSKPVVVDHLREGRPGTAAVSLELPLRDLEPGEYVAQLTVIDRAGGKFAFSREPLIVLPAAETKP